MSPATDKQRRLGAWIHRRKGPLAGAVAAHLSELNDDAMGHVPFLCDVMVDLHAVLEERIDASAVSLAWRASPTAWIYRIPGSPGHQFCCSFSYALDDLDPESNAMDLAHESPFRTEWMALSRSEKFALLVSHFVSQDAAEILFRELVQERMVDPDKMF